MRIPLELAPGRSVQLGASNFRSRLRRLVPVDETPRPPL